MALDFDPSRCGEAGRSIARFAHRGLLQPVFMFSATGLVKLSLCFIQRGPSIRVSPATPLPLSSRAARPASAPARSISSDSQPRSAQVPPLGQFRPRWRRDQARAGGLSLAALTPAMPAPNYHQTTRFSNMKFPCISRVRKGVCCKQRYGEQSFTEPPDHKPSEDPSLGQPEPSPVPQATASRDPLPSTGQDFMASRNGPYSGNAHARSGEEFATQAPPIKPARATQMTVLTPSPRGMAPSNRHQAAEPPRKGYCFASCRAGLSERSVYHIFTRAAGQGRHVLSRSVRQFSALRRLVI